MFKYIFVGIVIICTLLGGWFLFEKYNNSVSDNFAEIMKIVDNETTKLNLIDGVYDVDVDKSAMTWTGNTAKLVGTGTIDLINGKVIIEDQIITNGDFIVNMNSINTLSIGPGLDADALTDHLKNEDFFNTEIYPETKFEFKEMIPTDDDFIFSVKGDLTIHEITNEIMFLAALYNIDENTVKAVSSIMVDRTEWGIKYGSDKFFSGLGDRVIADNFIMDLELVANKK